MSIVDLNVVAKQVKTDSRRAVASYDEDTQQALKLFKRVLENAETLKEFRKREETVAICKLNLAAAKIGTGDIQHEDVGKEMLIKLKGEEHTDNLLLASISFHLGLVSPRPESHLYKNIIQHKEKLVTIQETSKLTDGESQPEIEEYKHHIQKLLESLSRFKEEQLGHLSEALRCLPKPMPPERLLDALVLKERIHEKRIQIFDKDLQMLKELQRKRYREYLRAAVTDIQAKKLPDMVDLEEVYKQLYPLLNKHEYMLVERPEDVLHKEVANLLRLGNLFASGDGSERRKARDYANRCHEILERNWTDVDMTTCNDLGIIYSQIKEFSSAKQCFLRLQYCSSNDQADKIYVFQNLGSVCVLMEKYEDAVHHFKDALHILEGLPKRSERRAHLYMNLGFAFSQMGRGRIWKAFEAYFNAAKYASQTDTREDNLRISALEGMTLSARVILDYREEMAEFIQEYVTKQDQNQTETVTETETETVTKKHRDRVWKGEESDLTNLIEKALEQVSFSDCIENLKKAVLYQTLTDSDKQKAKGKGS